MTEPETLTAEVARAEAMGFLRRSGCFWNHAASIPTPQLFHGSPLSPGVVFNQAGTYIKYNCLRMFAVTAPGVTLP